MPVHEWTRVDSGLFHSFHQCWITALCGVLNAGRLPPDYFALAEQSIRGPIPDVLTLRLSAEQGTSREDLPGGTAPVAVAVADAPPRARVVRTTDRGLYARKADRVTVRHRHGRVIAVVEIVSPGNKGATGEFRAFVEKTSDLIQQGVHVLVIDLFPPTRRDPQGVHKANWDEFEDEDFTPPADKPLTLAAYSADAVKTAYVEPIAVGDVLPDMPLFLEPEAYVQVPLETTYETSWGVFPAALKGLLGPVVPTPSAGNDD